MQIVKHVTLLFWIKISKQIKIFRISVNFHKTFERKQLKYRVGVTEQVALPPSAIHLPVTFRSPFPLSVLGGIGSYVPTRVVILKRAGIYEWTRDVTARDGVAGGGGVYLGLRIIHRLHLLIRQDVTSQAVQAQPEEPRA